MEDIRRASKNFMDSSNTNHKAPVLQPNVLQNQNVDILMNAYSETQMDTTVFTSPIPQACSTGRKGKELMGKHHLISAGNTKATIFASPITQVCSSDLINNRMKFIEKNDLIPVKDTQQYTDTSYDNIRMSDVSETNRSQLLKKREELHNLAMKTLERRHSKYGKQIPSGLTTNNLHEQMKEQSIYTLPLANDSTISESDFSNPQIMPRFTPSARSSSLSGASFIEEERIRLDAMSECLEDPDVDVSKLIQKYLEESEICNMSIKSNYRHANNSKISISSDDFVPGENALSRLQADEKSWYREKMSEIPVSSNSTNFTVGDNFDGAQSIGEFFWKKTEPLTNLSLQSSPEKHYKPVPLVDETSSNISSIQLAERDVTKKMERDSAITLSMIKRALPHLQMNDSPRAVMKNIPEEFKKPKINKNETVNKQHRSSMISSNSSKFTQNIETPSKFHTFIKQDIPAENKENSVHSKNKENSAYSESKETEPSKQRKVIEILTDSVNLPVKTTENSPNVTETGSLGSDACSELEFTGQTESSPCPTPAMHSCSRSSTATTGSVQSLTGGKLPIESTRTELVWECIKIGKTSMQEFVLRNRANLRLRLSLSVSGTAFKIHKSGQEFVNSLTVVLHSLESRTITVAFTPSCTGAHCEKLTFNFNERDSTEYKRQTIYCFGYGGCANVEIGNITKDSGGRMWMLLGQVGQRAPLRCKFVVRNTGNLTAFMAVQQSSKMKYHLIDVNSELTIEPMRCVLQPKEEKIVTVTLLVKNDDYRSFYDHCRNGNIIDVGYFSINTGAEVTRARLRRLFRKQTTDQNVYENIFKFLNVQYPEEKAPTDLSCFKETTSSIKKLLKGLVRREISVTVEMDPDMTLMAPMDDTCMFKSLCGETTLFSKQNETTDYCAKENRN